MDYTIDGLLEKALLTAAKIGQASARGEALTRLARVYLQVTNPAKSKALLIEALRTADTLKYPHEKAKALAGIAAVLVKNGQIEKAREQFSRAVLLARAAESPAQTIEALYRVANLCIEAKLSLEAVEILEEMHKLVLDPENEADSAAELVNIAELYDDLGQKETAATVLDEATRIAEKIPDNWFKLERLIEIADSYSSIGEIDKPLPILNDTPLLVAKIEEYSRPYFLLRTAAVYIALNRNSEAIEILRFIPSIIVSEGSDYESAGVLVEVAEKYLEIAENTAAVALLVQAIVLSESVTDLKEKIALQIEIAEWLDEAGHLDEALKLAAKAYQGCQNLPQKAAIFSLANLAILYVYMNNSEKAGQIVDEIIRNVKETAARTSGLGAVSEELAIECQPELALKLAEIIKEPEIQVGAWTKIIQSLIEAP